MRILSIDCESNGLYGRVWAIGAVVWDTETESLVEQFAEMVEDPVDNGAVTDPWVIENVVPHVQPPAMKPVKSWITLLSDFSVLYLAERERGALVLSDFAAPVEAGLFRDLVNDAHIGVFDAPYPLHELGTMLLAAGIDPDIDRVAFSGYPGLVPHNPADDATASLGCWLKARAILANGPTS